MSRLTTISFGSLCVAAAVAVALCAVANSPHARAAEVSASTGEGRQIYERICQGCHMPDAKGAIGAGKYPALAGDPALASRQFMALTLLNGRRNMPAFSAKRAMGFTGTPASLSSVQIAAVINYVRSNFGNHFTDAITPEEVGALDQATK